MMDKVLFVRGVPLLILARDGFQAKICHMLTGEISWWDLDLVRTWGWLDAEHV